MQETGDGAQESGFATTGRTGNAGNAAAEAMVEAESEPVEGDGEGKVEGGLIHAVDAGSGRVSHSVKKMAAKPRARAMATRKSASWSLPACWAL